VAIPAGWPSLTGPSPGGCTRYRRVGRGRMVPGAVSAAKPLAMAVHPAYLQRAAKLHRMRCRQPPLLRPEGLRLHDLPPDPRELLDRARQVQDLQAAGDDPP
jgi:hypothetical protein